LPATRTPVMTLTATEAIILFLRIILFLLNIKLFLLLKMLLLYSHCFFIDTKKQHEIFQNQKNM
jgi:hypothetical protein